MLASIALVLFEAQGCSVTAGGTKFDLSHLPTSVVDVLPEADEDKLYKYQVSFCSDTAECQGNYGNMVRLRNSGLNTCLGIYGEWSNSANPAPTKTSIGFQMKFQSEYYCSDDFSKKYSSVFNFICGKNKSIGTLQAKKTGSDACEYSVDIMIDAACAGGAKPQGGGGDGLVGGLSGGSIFLIILLVLAFVYVMGAFGFNYHKEKAVGFPHKSFWCSRLPFWIKTGLMVTWVQIMTCWRFTMKKVFKSKEEDDKMEEGLIKDSDDEEEE